MTTRSLFASVVLGVLTVGAGSALADAPQGRPGQQNGYMPWRGNSFGAIYPIGVSSGPQQQTQAQIYDIAPALGQAAFAEAEFDNRWAELQILVDRQRKDFRISDEYMSAKRELDDAQHNYDAAVDVVLAHLQSDKDYKAAMEKLTQDQVALKSTGVGTGLRNVMAAEKLRDGSMVTQLEAVALTNDPAVQNARTRLVSADETLRLKEKQFESQLYNRPEVVAARGQMETARANKAGADGYLRGAYVTRSDQLNYNYQNISGNNVYLGGCDPYSRGYFGIGAF